MCDLTEEMLRNLAYNQAKWEAMVELETIEKDRIEAEEERALQEMKLESTEPSSVDKLLPNTEPSTSTANANIPKNDDLRRYSEPVDLQPKISLDPSRRESIHFMEGSTLDEEELTVDEKLSFRDSQFLFYSSISVNRTIKKPDTNRMVIAESLLPRFSIATVIQDEEPNRIALVLNENQPIQRIHQRPRPPVQDVSFASTSTSEGTGDSLKVFADSSSYSSFLDSSQNSKFQVTPSQTFDMFDPSMSSSSCLVDVHSSQKQDECEVQPFDFTDVASEGTENTDTTLIEVGIENPDPIVGVLHNRRSSAPSTSNASEIPRVDMRRCSVPVESHGIYDPKRLMFSFISKHI